LLEEFAKLESRNQALPVAIGARTASRTCLIAEYSPANRLFTKYGLNSSMAWIYWIAIAAKYGMEVDHDVDVVSDCQPQFLEHACELKYILLPIRGSE